MATNYYFDGPIMVSKTGAVTAGHYGHFGDGSGAAVVEIDGAAATARDLNFKSNDSGRWTFRCNATAEGGSDAGSDFEIQSRDDSGSLNFNAITIVRSSGVVKFVDGDLGNPSIAFANDTDTGIYRNTVSGAMTFVHGGDSFAAGVSQELIAIGGKFTVTGGNSPHVQLDPLAVNPPSPGSDSECYFYVSDSGFFTIKYRDGATNRYKYLDLNGTGVTWVHSTTDPS
jgi:hypothetical protein